MTSTQLDTSARRETSNGRRHLVINFHGIGEVPVHVGAAERPFWCSTSLFTTILDEVGEASARSGLPIRITFDDGNDTDALIALDELTSRGLSADFFVCAGRIGQPGYLDETQIRELRDAGMGIGSHGWAHTDWRGADDATLTRELATALSRLSEVVGSDVDHVAIPFGSYDRRVIRSLRRTGVRMAYSSDRGVAGINDWLTTRETCTDTWVEGTLTLLATTRPPLIERVRRRAARAVKRLR